MEKNNDVFAADEEERDVAVTMDQDQVHQNRGVVEDDAESERRRVRRQQEDRADAEDKDVPNQSVNEFKGGDSEAAERDAESKIDSFLRGRCELAAASEKKEKPARRKRSRTAKPYVSICDEKRLKISLKDISTRTELAAALGVHVRAISLVTMTSETCSTDGCNLLAACSNQGRCILCQRTWFPHNSTKRGWGLYGRQFLSTNYSEGFLFRQEKFKRSSPCCCENPLCKKIGYSHEGMMHIPSKPELCEEFLKLLGIASRERREEMARTPRSFLVSPWHFRPEHRERRASTGRWRLRRMDAYEDADGNSRPFAPPDGDLQQFIDYEIPGGFRVHDDALPGWAARLARMQDGVAAPGDVEAINEGTPSFPPLPSSCAADEDDAKTAEPREDDKPVLTEKVKRSTSRRSAPPPQTPQPYWEQMFLKLVLYRARHGGSCHVPKRHYVNLPGLPTADLREFVRTIREHKRLLRLAEDGGEGVTHEVYERYVAAASVLTPKRIEALDGIEFLWEEPAKRVTTTWEERYEELARHHAEHGDCEPTDNPLLLKWCYKQRHQINNAMKETENMEGGSNPSTKIRERKAKLDGLNFIWHKIAPRMSWEERLDALKRFKEEHGHCNVKKYHHPSLGHWVNGMRTSYKDKIEGKKSPLTEEQILQLESIGFRWQLKKRHSKKTAQPQDEEEEHG